MKAGAENIEVYEVFLNGEKVENFLAKVEARNADFFNLIDEQITEKYGNQVKKVNHAGRTISLQ